jgi:hypothetical protein
VVAEAPAQAHGETTRDDDSLMARPEFSSYLLTPTGHISATILSQPGRKTCQLPLCGLSRCVTAISKQK